MTTEEKIKHFMDVTIRDASAKNEQVVKEYEDALNRIFEEHKEEAKRKADLNVHISEESLKKSINIAISKEQVQIKKDIGKKQSELKEKLFAEVKEKLLEYKKTSVYSERLVQQIKKAQAFAGGETLVIYIDPSDAHMLDALKEKTGAEILVSEYSFAGGMRGVLKAKNILIDNSFESRLREARESFVF